MTLLAAYDRARQDLADANSVEEVLQVRDAMAHAKLYAKQIGDKALLEEALVTQTNAERVLGKILSAFREAGKLAEGRKPKQADPERVTLDDIGVDRPLSSRAQKLAAMSDDDFKAIEDGVRQKVRTGRAILVDPIDTRQEDKKEHRANRERELGAKQTSLPDKRYGVIYADPEWRFKVYSRETGMDRAADNHYPTSETDAICARPVQSIAADDCVLFLWATVPMLPDALRVMSAWDFDYKSHSIWFKDRIGTGYWYRNQHELLLVGTRGNVPAPAMGTQFTSVNQAPVGEHSEKPDSFYLMIETYFPTLPKIELNARRARAGWDRWGLEAEAETSEEAA
jgi:N6-adenosine-specific RNA methylase IME4